MDCCSLCGTGVSYDERGNLAEDKDDYMYSYDYDNRLVKIEKPDGPDEGTDLDPVAEFVYDAIGRRVEKYDAVADVTTRYYYDGQRVLLETNYVDGEPPTETDLRYFVYGNYIDEVLIMKRLHQAPYFDYYFGHDHLFSPVVMFTITGSPFERYEYDAYGTCHVLDANFADDADGLPDVGNPYLFTGRRLDFLDAGDLKLYYYRARSYDSYTGRFLQRDPLGYVDSMNRYQYVASNSVLNTDPLGLFTLDVPATKWKCALLYVIMSGSYFMNEEGTLFYLWETGQGAEVEGGLSLEMAWFDKDGSVREGLRGDVKGNLRWGIIDKKFSLDCGKSTDWTKGAGSASTEVFSHIRMINAYRMSLTADLKVTKVCEQNCCKFMQADFLGHFRATDRVDWNRGQYFHILGTKHMIADQLVVECYPEGKDYDIYSETNETNQWKIDCKTGEDVAK